MSEKSLGPSRGAEPLYPSGNLRIGVVIGTHASVPYIALQLASRAKHWPDAAVVIHDDSSGDGERLALLCRQNGVDFRTTERRMGWCKGDLSAFVSGFDWAVEQKLDILVKVSRRFLFKSPWTQDLCLLAALTQYPTYSSPCVDLHHPIRSECMAMHVESWIASGVVDEMRSGLDSNLLDDQPLEPRYHAYSRRVFASAASADLQARDRFFARGKNWDGYGVWPILGLGRRHPMPHFLWHDADYPEDYAALADEVGLVDYTLADFRDPNTGATRRLVVPERQRPSHHVGGIGLPERNAGARAELKPVEIRADDALRAATGNYDWAMKLIRRRVMRRGGNMPWNTYRRLLRFPWPSTKPLATATLETGEKIVGTFRDGSFVESVSVDYWYDGHIGFIARRLKDHCGAYVSIGLNANLFTRKLAMLDRSSRLILVESDEWVSLAVAANSISLSNRANVFRADALGSVDLADLDRRVGQPIAFIRIGLPSIAAAFCEFNMEYLSARKPEIVMQYDDGSGRVHLDALIAAADWLAGNTGYTASVVYEDGTFGTFPERLEGAQCLIHFASD